MSGRAKLTVLIPCKNERHHIRACVDSARLAADEILVADSGSTDGTPDIVRSLGGCRLIEREFIGYASFKNWAIPQAAHEWVFVLDADERITPELAREIRQILTDPPPLRAGFWVYRRNFIMGQEVKYGGWGNDRVFRLFRRDECRYNRALVHEEIEVNPQRAGRLRERLHHYSAAGYTPLLDKLGRYALLAAEEARARGRRPQLHKMLLSAPIRFVHTYFVRLGFLDGLLGFQIAALTAFGSYLKQARLWELCYAGAPPPETAVGESPRHKLRVDAPHTSAHYQTAAHPAVPSRAKAA